MKFKIDRAKKFGFKKFWDDDFDTWQIWFGWFYIYITPKD